MPNLPSFFDRQSPEVQYTMHRMAKDSTAEEIMNVMKDEYGVVVNSSNIAYYRHIRGIWVGRYARVVPADTFDERIGQYIDAIKVHNGASWNNRNIGCRGAAWARCARRLCDAGLIRRIVDTRPVRYELLVDVEVIDVWYCQEVNG